MPGSVDIANYRYVKGFTPSSYNTNLTMDGTAQTFALATGVARGQGYVHICNLGATTEAIRVAFGTDATDAGDNLNIAAEAATTGYYIPAAADAGGASCVILGAPSNATHCAVANAVAADTQTVAVTQGI